MASQNIEELERQFNSAMEEADTGSSLDAIRRVYGELDSEEPSAIAAIVHPKFELHVNAAFLDGKTYRGVRGYLNWRRELDELFEEQRFQPVGIRFAGRDRWAVLGRMHIKEKDDGSELDLPLAHVCEQRDRKVARITVFSDISAALDSIGLYF